MLNANLTAAELEELRLIAAALEANQALDINTALVGLLIKKCMVRTNGKSLKVTADGIKALQGARRA